MWAERRGFRRGSNALVQCDLSVLERTNVRLFESADGALLAEQIPPESNFRVLAADNQRGEDTVTLAEVWDRLIMIRDLHAEAVQEVAAGAVLPAVPHQTRLFPSAATVWGPAW